MIVVTLLWVLFVPQVWSSIFDASVREEYRKLVKPIVSATWIGQSVGWLISGFMGGFVSGWVGWSVGG